MPDLMPLLQAFVECGLVAFGTLAFCAFSIWFMNQMERDD